MFFCEKWEFFRKLAFFSKMGVCLSEMGVFPLVGGFFENRSLFFKNDRFFENGSFFENMSFFFQNRSFFRNSGFVF